MSKIDLILNAKERLRKRPYDSYHTLTHHFAVLENVHLIWQVEDLDINIEVLEIATWCHDLFKGVDNEDSKLKEYLSTFAINDIDKIVEIISEHSFGKLQTSTESKILYDADKIDLVSITRWKHVFEEYESGKVSLEGRDRYIDEWNRRMPILIEELHFKSSMQLFQLRYWAFVHWLKSIKRYEKGLFV